MPTPENLVKNAIFLYLQTIKAVVPLFWQNASVGIYDPGKGCFRRPVSKFQISGVSDILGILADGRFIAIEVKSKKGRLSIDQNIFLEEIKRNGGVAFMARSVDDVIDNFKKFGLLK